MNELKGLHHITAITSSAEKIYDFFTYTLGLRLVKKTVNQDDIQTYHLYFTDDVGSPGTDMTFFDFPGIPKGIHGTNEISKTSFRVPNDAALEYWVKRFWHCSPRCLPSGDEPYETLGERLSLPPFFEEKRDKIEKLVRPFDTVRSTKQFEKEYE